MSQKVVHGIENAIDYIKDKNFLLIRGRSYDHLEIKSYFENIPHIEFSEFTPNPLYEQVCEGIKLFNNNNCTMIVAVGGGSAIDVAKCIKLFCKMDPSINYLEQEKVDTGIPLMAIPTTAGTGSESTRHAVIYYEGKKQSINHPSIVPDFAVLEPSTLANLPVYQKKCTMLDALCQAIESWWSVSSNAESVNYSRQAIQMIVDNWKGYIFDNLEESAAKIMDAANYGGRAINITTTTAAHAMSYKITSMYKIPHGHAAAICLPEVWEYMLEHADDCIDSRGSEHLRRTLSEIDELISLKQFRELLAVLEMDYPVSNNKEADLNLLTESVNPIRLKNNPVALDSNVLHEMYERILK
jgi:alcohol dehydrogenase class IV